jgi:hypothetical protein
MTLRHPSDLVNDETVTALPRSIPPLLYKYSGLAGDRLEWMRRLIVNSELYFAQPNTFNDPLDCRIPPRFEASALKAQRFWRAVVRRNCPGQNMRNYRQIVQKMVKDSKTLDGQKSLTGQVLQSLDEHGMVCLARDPKNMLLWSYYSEGHSGIAVRFNMDLNYLAAIPKEFFPVEVQYANNFPNTNYYESTTHEFLKSILGTKSSAWEARRRVAACVGSRERLRSHAAQND